MLRRRRRRRVEEEEMDPPAAWTCSAEMREEATTRFDSTARFRAVVLNGEVVRSCVQARRDETRGG